MVYLEMMKVNGFWVLRFDYKSYSTEVVLVEFHALLVVLRLAWNYGNNQVIVETNCLNLITYVSCSIQEVLP